MTALAAYNYGRQKGIWNVEALERYHGALPKIDSLNYRIDMCSNGLVFTHFFLLIYEVAPPQVQPFLIHS